MMSVESIMCVCGLTSELHYIETFQIADLSKYFISPKYINVLESVRYFISEVLYLFIWHEASSNKDNFSET